MKGEGIFENAFTLHVNWSDLPSWRTSVNFNLPIQSQFPFPASYAVLPGLRWNR